MAGSGAIDPLVELLRSREAAGKQNRAGAPRNLAAGSEERKAAVAAVGAIEPLVELLRSGEAAGKERAAWALRNLAANQHVITCTIMH